jgi:hypothetical protein
VTVLSTQRFDINNIHFCLGYDEAVCGLMDVNIGQCNIIPSDWDKKISTYEPPEGTFCILSEHANFSVTTKRLTT